MSPLIAKILLSSAGVTFLLFVVARILPNEKIKAAGVRVGRGLSLFGVGKLGKALWEKVEDFLENSSTVFLDGVKEGLDADDNETDQPNQTTPPKA